MSVHVVASGSAAITASQFMPHVVSARDDIPENSADLRPGNSLSGQSSLPMQRMAWSLAATPADRAGLAESACARSSRPATALLSACFARLYPSLSSKASHLLCCSARAALACARAPARSGPSPKRASISSTEKADTGASRSQPVTTTRGKPIPRSSCSPAAAEARKASRLRPAQSSIACETGAGRATRSAACP